MIALPAAVALLLVTVWQAPAAKAPQPAQPEPIVRTAIDSAFARLYNFDFAGALALLDKQAQTDPANPLVHSVRAGAFLFTELDRMKILESEFFMDNDNMADGKAHKTPDPVTRARLFEAVEKARQAGRARLAVDPYDRDALLAMCMASGVEVDYTALVERRTWRSVRIAGETTKHADTLLKMTPPGYDAYLNFGSLEYIVGSLPFFIRWFVHYDGIQGSKQRGIEQLKLAAYHGRYYGPFARILLAVVALREKQFGEAQKILAELAREYPENPLFKRELARVEQTLRKKERL